jgi:hypothetical protein
MIFLLRFNRTSVGGGEDEVGSAHYAGLMRMSNFLKNPLSNGLSRDAMRAHRSPAFQLVMISVCEFCL